MSELIWSFAPWVLFIMADRVTNVYVAAGVAGLAAIVVLARAMTRHKAHLFDVAGVIYFVGLLVVLAIVHPSDIATWGRYAQAVAHGSLCVIVFGSVLVGHPFTESYARDQAPRRSLGHAGLPCLQPQDLDRLGICFPGRGHIARVRRCDRFSPGPAPRYRSLRGTGSRLHLYGS